MEKEFREHEPWHRQAVDAVRDPDQALLQAAGSHIADPVGPDTPAADEVDELCHSDVIAKLKPAECRQDVHRLDPSGRGKALDVQPGALQDGAPGREPRLDFRHRQTEELRIPRCEQLRPQAPAIWPLPGPAALMRVAVQDDFRSLLLLLLQKPDQVVAALKVLRNDLEDTRARLERVELVNEVANVVEGVGGDVVNRDDELLDAVVS